MEYNTQFVLCSGFQLNGSQFSEQTLVQGVHAYNKESYANMVVYLPTLNSQCVNLAESCLPVLRNAPFYAQPTMEASSEHRIDFEQIHCGLKSIPIYENVVKAKQGDIRYAGSENLVN